MSTSTTNWSGEKCVFELRPPDAAPPIIRRTADAIRLQMMLAEDSPPGVYLQRGEDSKLHLALKGLDGTDIFDNASSELTALEHLSVTSSETLHEPESFDMGSKKAQEPMRVASEGLRSIPKGTVTEVAIDRDTVLRYIKGSSTSQCYTLKITFSQSYGGSEAFDCSFILEADTGSNTTWIFHKDVLRLLEIGSTSVTEDSTTTTMPDHTVDLIKLEWFERSPRRPALWDDSITTLTRICKDAEPNFKDRKMYLPTRCHYPRVAYMDESVALVIPMNAPGKSCTLENCYDWNASGKWEVDDIKVDFAFGVCDAATDLLLRDKRVDGVLGFGTWRYQTAFEGFSRDFGCRDQNLPSFLEVFQGALQPVTGRDGGIVMYYILHHPGTNLSSYLAYNAWPEILCTLKGGFTEKILIANPTSQHWRVAVKQIIFKLRVRRSHADRYQSRDIAIDFGNYEFALDTGTSCTYFPHDAFSRLVATLDTAELSSFTVPDYVDLKHSRVQYVFLSEGTPVVFEGPVELFLCDKSRKGLIWEMPEYRSTQPQWGILGLNFFHTAAVALHKPDLNKTPYVRLAERM